MRIKKKPDVATGVARINTNTCRELGIEGKIEVVVAGKKKLELEVIPVDELPPNEVYSNPETLTKAGIADNSIATIRAASGV